MKKNDNCLEGFACPSCGSQGPFIIPTIGHMVWDDTGVDVLGDNDLTVEPEFDFAEGAVWACIKCRTRHPMSEFRAKENSDLINKYPLSTAVQRVLIERMHVDADEFDGELGLVTAAYETGHGCVNDAVWDTDTLETTILRKFKYAYIGIMELLGFSYLEYDVVVEPSYEDTTTTVVIMGDKVIHNEHAKAWNFAGDSLEDIEKEFKGIAESITKKLTELSG